MNIYRIITHDFHDIFFQQEPEATGFLEELKEPKIMMKSQNPDEETPHSEEVPGGSAEDKHAVPGTCEVSCLY
jgi:hypothetical protein